MELSSTDENSFDLDCEGSIPFLLDNRAEKTYRSRQKKKRVIAFAIFYWSPFVTCLSL